MTAHQSPAQKKTVARVMHEFKHGELRRNDGSVVTDSKQAIAVALSEAGASGRVDEASDRHDPSPRSTPKRAAAASPAGQG